MTTQKPSESEFLAQKLVDWVSCATQLDNEKDELPNVEDWQRNAEKLFRETLTRVREEAFKRGFERGVEELPPSLRRP